jgi:hypothetical protein
MLMPRRSREALAVAKHLCTYWDLGPGAVEVRWTDGWFKGGAYRQGWEIAWDDGRTVQRMRQAARQVPAGPTIGDLVRAERAWSEERRTLPAPLPEVLMSHALATFGLDALMALEHAGNVIKLPHHGLNRDDRLGLP